MTTRARARKKAPQRILTYPSPSLLLVKQPGLQALTVRSAYSLERVCLRQVLSPLKFHMSKLYA